MSPDAEERLRRWCEWLAAKYGAHPPPAEHDKALKAWERGIEPPEPGREPTFVELCEKLIDREEKPTVDVVEHLVRAYYAVHGNEAGGSLHILLDDGNVSDDSVRFCVTSARRQDDEKGEALARVLLRMSKTQRLKLAKLRHLKRGP